MAADNPMNCETCDHHKINKDKNLHCYMFKDTPTEVCGVHTGFKSLGPIVSDDLRRAIQSPSFSDLIRPRTSIFESAVESVMGSYKT